MTVSATEIYKQQCEDFRALNTIFWQLPVILMTLNGGLWFALGGLDLTETGQRGLLAFAAVVDIAFIVAMIRLRLLLKALLKKIHAVQGDMTVAMGGVTVAAFCGLLLLAAAGAGAAALNPAAVLSKTPKPAPVIICIVDGRAQPSTGNGTCPPSVRR